VKEQALIPFAMRYVATQTVDPPAVIGVTYNETLQISLTSDGNPWAHSAPAETSSNTNLDSRNDESTDFY
jgi:putative ATP-grasp target RiPP